MSKCVCVCLQIQLKKRKYFISVLISCNYPLYYDSSRTGCHNSRINIKLIANAKCKTYANGSKHAGKHE